jgi:hypothetical protein
MGATKRHALSSRFCYKVEREGASTVSSAEAQSSRASTSHTGACEWAHTECTLLHTFVQTSDLGPSFQSFCWLVSLIESCSCHVTASALRIVTFHTTPLDEEYCQVRAKARDQVRDVQLISLLFVAINSHQKPGQRKRQKPQRALLKGATVMTMLLRHICALFIIQRHTRVSPVRPRSVYD